MFKNIFKKKDKINENKFIMFRGSRPWGYYPPDVERTIAEKDNEIEILKNKNEILEANIREMHIQMSNIELPDTEEIVEMQVLNSFANLEKKPNKIKINKKG